MLSWKEKNEDIFALINGNLCFLDVNGSAIECTQSGNFDWTIERRSNPDKSFYETFDLGGWWFHFASWDLCGQYSYDVAVLLYSDRL